MENINDLIYAYSLGCLEDDELQRLKSYQDSEEEPELRELGEFQNLVSLLPSTLTIENPDPELKDNVAKKLYRLKDEIKAQRQKNKPMINVQETNVEKEPEISLKEMVNSLKEPEYSLKEPEGQTPENNTFQANELDDNDAQNLVEGTFDLSSIKKNPPSIMTPTAIKKNNNFMIWGIVIIILLALGIMVVYFNMSLKTNSLNSEVEKLKKEIGSLNVRLISNQEISEILQSPDVQIINLKGTNLTPTSFGKIIIGADRETGYIQLAQMPSVAEYKLFQLWVSISGSYISLKTFQPSDTMGFYSFKMLNLPKGDEINFLVTEESSKGSTTPDSKIFLRGSFTP